MLTRKLVAMGYWPAAFMDIDPAVPAAGTTVADATQLRSSKNVVTTGTGGVILPKGGEPGDEVLVTNATGAGINAYAPSGELLNGGTSAQAIATAATTRFICTFEGKWITT